MPAPATTPADDPAPRWPLASVACIVVLCWLALSWPWLSGIVTIPWDAKAHFHPQLQFLADSWHRGLSPFWAPYVFSGSPQVADPQSLIFSPPFALIAALNPTPDFRWSDGAVLGTLLVGALAIVLIFRDRGWHPAGAVVAALSFAFGAAAAWRIQHVGQVLSLGYFAVTLLLLSRALGRGSVGYGFAAGLASGFMVLGRDQVALIGVYVLAGLTIAAILMARSPWRAFRASIPLLLAGTLGAILVATIPILLTAFIAQESNRPAIDFVEAGKGSLHPAALLTGLIANLYGAAGPLADFWGAPSPAWEARFSALSLFLARNMSQLYLGLLPMGLILTVGLVRGALWRREIVALSVAALIVLLYALGRYTPAFRLLFELPGISFYRRPADALFILGALLAILGGYLTHLVMTGTAPKARPWQIALEALAFAAALALAIWLAWTVGRLPLAISPLVIALLCGMLTLGGLVAARGLAQRGSALAATIVLAMTLVMDLSVNNGPSESTALPAQTYDVLRKDSTNETIALLKRETARTAAPDRRDRIELAAIDFHWPNASLVHELDNTLGYNPLRLGLYSKATGAGDHVALPDQRSFSALMPGYRSLLADMLGLRFIATGVPAEQIDKRLKPGDLRQIARTQDAYVYENPRALPRVLLVTEAQKADFDTILSSGQWPAGFDPHRTVLLDRAPPPLATAAIGPARVAIRDYGTTSVLLAVDAPRGGYLVLNDVWHHWWQVEIDGKPAELLRANVLFRAVVVPPGKSTVRFAFHPLAGLWRDIVERLRPVRPAPAG
ncbi:Glycosyltransferase family 39 protein [Hyphomicrobiales bacterium]|nr:Glycosyltransferase family 39 protein [Hyphomicrobiales bacterium]CAH1699697.1 Glycosyltransferase family 39 protein [Hyphomicrobiales bacterium]CAI0343428.1 Glycosyltransferase family 39 protein [Hyphomicrobiales bacterium]